MRNVGGISSGGEASECLDLLHPSVLAVGRDAIRAIPTMDWGGADILVAKDTGEPYLLELNTNAAVSNSTYPVYGEPKDVAGPAWERLLASAPIDGVKSTELTPPPHPLTFCPSCFPPTSGRAPLPWTSAPTPSPTILRPRAGARSSRRTALSLRHARASVTSGSTGSWTSASGRVRARCFVGTTSLSRYSRKPGSLFLAHSKSSRWKTSGPITSGLRLI